ncbi:MAG: hypothetical protein KGH94_04895, partial [Candidatus Micrarchaeota archaeon]|nr:hypothetical protein [Candidatus Micrarchaeota archaeon]
MGLSQDSFPKDFSYNPWVSRGDAEIREAARRTKSVISNIADVIKNYPYDFEIYKHSKCDIWDTDFV